MQPKNDMQSNQAPQQACWFTDKDTEALVQFVEGADTKGNRVKVVGYSGGIIPNHWYWGNLAFDLKGMRFAKKRTPILCQHDVGCRIAVADKQGIEDGQVVFEGGFLGNNDAQKIKQDMAEGFAFEASLYIPPTVIEHVQEGESVEVNGQSLKGPGTVFRKSLVKEVSICVFGADSATSAQSFELQPVVCFERTGKEPNMADTATKLTLEVLQKDHQDVYQAAFKAGQTDGEARERQIFKEILAASDNDAAIAAQCYCEGKGPQDAMAMKLAAVKAERDQFKAQAQTQTQVVTPPAKTVDPAYQEFSDGQAVQAARKTTAGDIDAIDPENFQAVKAAWGSNQKFMDEYLTPEAMQHDLRKRKAK